DFMAAGGAGADVHRLCRICPQDAGWPDIGPTSPLVFVAVVLLSCHHADFRSGQLWWQQSFVQSVGSGGRGSRVAGHLLLGGVLGTAATRQTARICRGGISGAGGWFESWCISRFVGVRPVV